MTVGKPGAGPHSNPYRADIDGLRAIAVLAVVFFHLDIPPFSGGYVGVDVFFVISGYLITRLLLSDWRAGEFSLARFYERRIRRILPALLVVAGATTATALALMLPAELEEFGKSLASMALFSSNFYFWSEADYFETAAILKPLLHTWSLAVEEQFYILYPLLLYLALRWGTKGTIAVLSVLATASFLWSIDQTQDAPAAAFYLLPSRAWELLIGALLALAPAARLPRLSAEALAALGVLLIGVAVVTYDQATAFPGLAAAIPCLGTAALIVAGGTPTAALVRGLRWPPLVWLGLISYSLYLWHWPMVVFGTYVAMRELTAAETAIVFGASIVLSAWSWRFVEQPVRRRDFLHRLKPLFAGAFAASAAFVAIGATIDGTEGLPARLPQSATAILDPAQYLDSYRRCHSRDPEELERFDVCRIGRLDAEPSFLLWGDSHAAMLIGVLAKAADRVGRSGVVFTRAGCAPELGTRLARGADESCARMQASILAYLRAYPGVRDVILAGYWRRQATGSGYDDAGVFRLDEHSREASEAETLAVFRRGLTRLIAALPGRHIYLISDIPEIGFNPPHLLARQEFLGLERDPDGLAIAWAEYRDGQEPATAVLQSLADLESVSLVPVDDLLCPVLGETGTRKEERLCPITMDGRVLYRDGDHLSVHGAELLLGRFEEMLAGKLRDPTRTAARAPPDADVPPLR